ncbi:hypothetical protein NQ317_011747 [Molorchus minor]|uniref:Tc1-like transposase DDE domain-containing protein n=1 Tax=Molorchus minor TaxID=1323400 RepID=A0ABQ9JTD0_9CUCU|nr:hypothetical protein NQ317_011747 [Molorchus minor]
MAATDATCSGFVTSRKRRHLTNEELQMIKNVYEGIRARNLNIGTPEAVDICTSLTKVCDHLWIFLNELPTLNKIEAAVARDENLPKVSRKLLLRTRHEMNFHHLKRNRKSLLLIEKTKLWYGEEVIWKKGFSPGLKAPSGRGRRLIITHIGSDSGFLENGLNVFESRRTRDYHEDMNSALFETWFSSVLSSIKTGAIVVMDNASYHSRQTEKLPKSAWQKFILLSTYRVMFSTITR